MSSRRTSTSTETPQQRWPVRFADHHLIEKRILYDVEGNLLVDKSGKMLNIFRDNFQVALDKKEVRIFRNSTMKEVCYRYFITSQEQLDMFWEEREYGTTDGPNKRYHVYVDDDCDKSCATYKKLFYNSLYG